MLRRLCLALGLLILCLAAHAASEARQATGRYVLGCEGAGSGTGVAKSEAIYACALSAATQGGALGAQDVQHCRADLAGAARPNTELWHCALLRRYGPQMPMSEWRSATMQDCRQRAARAGNRYQGQAEQCMVDAVIAEQRVPDATVQTCRQGKDAAKPARLLSCLLKPAPGAAAGPDAANDATRAALGVPPGWLHRVQGTQVNPRSACAAYAQAHPMEAAVRDEFLRLCPKSTRAMDDLAASAQQTARQNAQRRQGESADYPPERVAASVRQQCDGNNRSGILVFDCECAPREAQRALARSPSPRAVAQGQFDWSPCIDRARSADRFVAQTFTPQTSAMMSKAGVDVPGYKACAHRAIARDMDVASLTNATSIQGEIKRLCVQKRG